jgi:hypothetical protein
MTRGDGKVKAGDLVVTNIGNTDTGNTLVAFPQHGDLLVVNLDENTLVELNMSASTVIGTKFLFSSAPD